MQIIPVPCSRFRSWLFLSRLFLPSETLQNWDNCLDVLHHPLSLSLDSRGARDVVTSLIFHSPLSLAPCLSLSLLLYHYLNPRALSHPFSPKFSKIETIVSILPLSFVCKSVRVPLPPSPLVESYRNGSLIDSVISAYLTLVWQGDGYTKQHGCGIVLAVELGVRLTVGEWLHHSCPGYSIQHVSSSGIAETISYWLCLDVPHWCHVRCR